MNSIKSYLNLRSLASKESRIVRAHSYQLGAAALCAAVLAIGAPVFAAAQASDTASKSTGTEMAPTISLAEAMAQHQTLKFVALIPQGESQLAPATAEGDTPLPALLAQDESQYMPLTMDPDSTSYYGTWTAYPYVHEFLVSFVAYNDRCQEITAGSWYEGSVAPKYGIVTQAHVKGKLSNGECSRYIFTGAGIFYQWVDKTSSSRSDEFKANWRGGSLENKVTFYLKDKK